jgi:hypothetical protein
LLDRSSEPHWCHRTTSQQPRKSTPRCRLQSKPQERRHDFNYTSLVKAVLAYAVGRKRIPKILEFVIWKSLPSILLWPCSVNVQSGCSGIMDHDDENNGYTQKSPGSDQILPRTLDARHSGSAARSCERADASSCSRLAAIRFSPGNTN